MAIEYPNEQNFDRIVSEGFWIADFYTDHCGPCKLLDRIISDIVADDPDINWAKCNLDDGNWGFQDRFGIVGTPTLLFFLDGEQKGSLMGGFHSREKVLEEISKYMYGE